MQPRLLLGKEVIRYIVEFMNLSVDPQKTAERIYQLCAFATDDMATSLYRDAQTEWEIAQGYHRHEENKFYENI